MCVCAWKFGRSYKKGNLKRETESLLIAAKNNTIRINYIKARIDKMQQNSKSIYTSRNTRRCLGSGRSFKNCTLIYESYCFDIIEYLGAEYLQAVIARLRPKIRILSNILMNSILVYRNKNIVHNHIDYKSMSILVTQKKEMPVLCKRGDSFIPNIIFLFFISIFWFIIFTNPSTRAGYDTRSIFKRILTGLNSEFSFS